VDVSDWERQIEQQLAELREHGGKLARAAAAIRGRAEARGVSVEVNTTGDITNLQIAASRTARSQRAPSTRSPTKVSANSVSYETWH
jgi:hypothetical protein